MEDNREEILLELDQYLVDYLVDRAILENKTVDQIVEDMLQSFLGQTKE